MIKIIKMRFTLLLQFTLANYFLICLDNGIPNKSLCVLLTQGEIVDHFFKCEIDTTVTFFVDYTEEDVDNLSENWYVKGIYYLV